MGFFSKIFKSPVFKIAMPVLGAMTGNPLLAAGAGALGGAGGGLKGSLLGAAGGYLGAGGLGTAAGTPLAGGAMGPTQGSGILGSLTRGTGAFSSALRGLGQGASNIMGSVGNLGGILGSGAQGGILGGSVGGLGNMSTLSNIYSGIQGTKAYKDMAKAQSAATNKAIEQYKPYQASGVAANTRLSGLLGLDGQDQEETLNLLRNSPGYQFRLGQGQNTLNRALASRGKLFSGEALKESQSLGQGLADQTYNDYIAQLRSTAGAGQQAAGGVAGLNLRQGDIGADRIAGQSQSINQALANIMGQGRLIGYDPKTGQPIYA